MTWGHHSGLKAYILYLVKRVQNFMLVGQTIILELRLDF